jgi:hypothetical protein
MRRHRASLKKWQREQNGRKPKGREHRKSNDFLTLPSKSMNLVEVASARRLISHFTNDFRELNNERVPGNCLSFFWLDLPSLARLCSCSAVSVVGLGCSVAFDFALH